MVASASHCMVRSGARSHIGRETVNSNFFEGRLGVLAISKLAFVNIMYIITCISIFFFF